MVRTDGPVTAQAGAQFLGSWVNVGGKISAMQKSLFESAVRGELGPAQVRNARTGAVTKGAQTSQLLSNRPKVDLAASEQFLTDVANTRNRLWVTTPYIGSDEIAKPLREAAAAGKDVRIIVPGMKSGRNLKLLAVSRTYYSDLLKAGAKVYELPSMMHAKSWISDDVTAVGSMNMSKNSFKAASELVLRSTGTELQEQYLKFFRDTMAASHELTVDEMHGFGLDALTAVRKKLNLQF
ncbi:MAG: hypothetical protein H7123_01140 [Thermoleophilia bacterium]|nr:hypothetical protein [Thermoleophilia bacterium]